MRIAGGLKRLKKRGNGGMGRAEMVPKEHEPTGDVGVAEAGAEVELELHQRCPTTLWATSSTSAGSGTNPKWVV